MKTIVKALLLSIGFSFATNNSLAVDFRASKLVLPHPEAQLSPPNERGEHLYQLWFRADVVDALGEEGEPPARGFHDPVNATDFRGWHRPELRKMARSIETLYDIRAVNLTSWAFPTMWAYISDEKLARIDKDFQIEAIYPSILETYSATPPWNDILGGEYMSYGKAAMDMNDSPVGTPNRVYMVDAGILFSPAHVDLGSVTQAPIGTECTAALGHARHVAGILTSTHNGQATMGMNNSGPVTSVNKGCGAPGQDGLATAAFDWIIGETEAAGTYTVINISANSYSYASGGGIAKFIRKASARNLVVESAGNFNDKACNRAYSPTLKGDGILVVGAVDRFGARAVNYDNSLSGYVSGESSSYGACVESWAPGLNIYSAWTGLSNSRMILSGTSMAAPHVAALAARYGNTTTHPVIREAYVRSKLFSTGSSDPDSFAIKIPSYTQSPLFTLPTKLTGALSVSSTYSTFAASKAVDSNYLTTSWNSGVTPNLAAVPPLQPWFQMDLGTTKSLWSIRLMPSQTPSGTSTHDIYVGNTDPPGTLAKTISSDIMNGEMISADLTGFSGRFVRVVTRVSPSWAAYYEVEVFGN